MRTELLGLSLERAQELLRGEGIEPQIAVTRSPRRAQDAGGTLRVVYASSDGKRLTAAAFLEPLTQTESTQA